MANRSQAEFVRQMLRLRAKHQNRLPHELIEQAGQVENHLAKQPKIYDERWCNLSNSPLIQQTHVLMRELREMGLYIDQHRDFNEAMQLEREKRGKPRPFRKFNDKKLRGEDKTWSRDEKWEA